MLSDRKWSRLAMICKLVSRSQASSQTVKQAGRLLPSLTFYCDEAESTFFLCPLLLFHSWFISIPIHIKGKQPSEQTVTFSLRAKRELPASTLSLSFSHARSYTLQPSWNLQELSELFFSMREFPCEPAVTLFSINNQKDVHERTYIPILLLSFHIE